VRPGPRTQEQLTRFGREWEQGQHVLLSGATRSGKTTLARHVVQKRIDAGGFVIVLVCKLRPDATIVNDYKGFTRWETFKKKPNRSENRVLLWPDLQGMPARKAMAIQREIFREAYDGISEVGNWTVQTDEGLYVCNPKFLGLEPELAMLHALGGSAGVTNVVLTQRPSHLPVVIYGSAHHAFVGRTRERTDAQRLSELGGRQSGKEMLATVAELKQREFLWIPVAPDWPSEIVDVSK